MDPWAVRTRTRWIFALAAAVAVAPLGTARAIDPVVIFSDGFESGSPCAWSAVAAPEICDGLDNDCDGQVDEDFGCTDGDACCPGGGSGSCNATNDDDCAPLCGNGIVEPGETCDGDCGNCDPEPYPCFESTGSALTCDLVCHVPVQQCAGGDGCCPYVAGGAGSCGAADDAECKGTSWNYVQWFTPIVLGGGCTLVNVYGIVPGGSYELTTCVPPGTQPGSGDSIITAVTDNSGFSYAVGNDDCSDPSAIPRLAGWNCLNAANDLRMSCASPSPGGFRAFAGAYRLSVQICGYNNTALSTPFFLWYNATAVPNPG